MYVWQLQIDTHIYLGRTWNEYISVINNLTDILSLNEKRKIFIFVHNLSFEFQFINQYFAWDKIFALDARKVVQAISNGIEYRCSYILSNTSLLKLGRSLKRKVEKLVGDLNYDLIRHSATPLNFKELEYCVHDCIIVCQYIRELMENNNIYDIPLTNTGFVRRDVKKRCLKTIGKNKYRNLMQNLYLEPEEYLMAKRVFMGGFTHANFFKVGKTLKNITSFDFKSSYPAVMVCEKFPMSKGTFVKKFNLDFFKEMNQKYITMFKVCFKNIRPKLWHENYISSSKCLKLVNAKLNNGRVISADYLEIEITNIDFDIINDFYEWENFVASDMWFYKKGYLPKPIISAVLDYFNKKTKYKGIKEFDDEYKLSKSNLNSIYGMIVTDIIREEIIFEKGEWKTETPDLSKAIAKYNSSKSRFLFYMWGLTITAYARRNLFSGIKSVGDDYCYSDTDSLKIENVDKHLNYIELYNNNILKKLKKTSVYYNLDWDLFSPKDPKGEIQILGMWDNEGEYARFKTLGAKRYVYEKDGEIHFTISGIKSEAVLDFLGKKCAFSHFKDGLTIPKENSQKLTLTYIDEYMSGEITDYLGNVYHYEQKYGIHNEKTTFKISLGADFRLLLRSIQSRKEMKE